MAKPKIVRTWIELSATYLGPKGGPPFDATLFVNRCEVRERGGKLYLLRRTDCEFIRAPSEKAMHEKVAAFALREDVRRLVQGLDANDFDALPPKVEDPLQDVIDGTAAIYQLEDEPPQAAGEKGEAKP